MNLIESRPYGMCLPRTLDAVDVHFTATWSTWVIYISGSAGMVVDRKIYTFMYNTSPQLKKFAIYFLDKKIPSFLYSEYPRQIITIIKY